MQLISGEGQESAQEREEFEKWAASAGLDLKRYDHGEYTFSYTIEHWKTWQAASRRKLMGEK